MPYAKLTIILAIMTACVTLSRNSVGQEYRKGNEVNRNVQLPPLAVDDADKKRKRLHEQISAQRGVDTADWCDSVLNPFTSLTSEGKEKLKARGVDCERLTELKAVLLTGSYYGAASKTFVNRDPDTILVIGKGFGGHADVYSLGPILAAENAHFMGNVTGGMLVWFVEQSLPRGKVSGLPVIVAPSVNHRQMRAASADVWHGDYGWHRPSDFGDVTSKAPSRAEVKKREGVARQSDSARQDTVIAVRDAVLKAGRRTVGKVRKGERLTVEQVQGEWLWVRSGETRGWIGKEDVARGQISMFYGVTFILPEKFTVNGSSMGPDVTRLKIGLKKENFELVLRRNGGVFTINGRPYGTLRTGDCVLIKEPLEVSVNGQVRRPR